MYGGIDLGGTKLEACLFDQRLQATQRQRIATPQGSYAELLDAVLQQCHWLEAQAQDALLPIGMGIPGLIDRRTGLSTTANLCASGQALQSDLRQRLGRAIAVENDCKCFALSEARGGSGQGFDVVLGLILGTGIGGGICRQGSLLLHHNGICGEVGHISLPAHCVARWNLPIIPCGCGRQGCYESYVSGPGMRRLCALMTGTGLDAPAIVQGVADGDGPLQQVFDAWLSLLCELLHTVQLAIDPDCVVLGGGLSHIPSLAQLLDSAFASHQLAGLVMPRFLRAKFGDSSGVRGAAMLAKLASHN